MARKRHLASTARGFCGLCLMTQIEVQKVQEAQWVQIRPIRLIRGRKRSLSSGVLPSRQRLRSRALYPRALPPVTQSSALQAPERMWRPIRGRIRLSRGKGIYLCLMAS